MTISNYSSGETQNDQEDIHPWDIVKKIWAERSVLYFGCVAGLLLGVLYLQVATYSYTATLVVIPTQSQTKSPLSGVGDLSILAGADILGGRNSTPFTYYPETLNSRAVADEMARKYPGIMQRIFADQWDANSQSWVKRTGPVKVVAKAVKAVLGIPSESWSPPGGAQLQQYIERRVALHLETRKTILTMTFQHPDPVFAAQFLQAVHQSTDQVLRKMSLERSSSYAAYLENKLATVQQADLRKVLIDSLGQQETLIMMSSSQIPFAAQPLSTATSSLRPTSPEPMVVLLACVALGAIAACALVGFGIATANGVRDMRYRIARRFWRSPQS